jgi:hypothetical protein
MWFANEFLHLDWSGLAKAFHLSGRLLAAWQFSGPSSWILASSDAMSNANGMETLEGRSRAARDVFLAAWTCGEVEGWEVGSRWDSSEIAFGAGGERVFLARVQHEVLSSATICVLCEVFRH